MSGLVVVLLVVAFVGGAVRHVVVAQLAEHEAELHDRRMRLDAAYWDAVRIEAAQLHCEQLCPRRCSGHPAPASALDPTVLRLAATLTHPDRHPQERQADATRVTAQLLTACGASRRSS